MMQIFTDVRYQCLMLAIIGTAFVIPCKPPGIVEQPDKEVYFIPGSTVKLPCHAEGEPTPLYTWKKNGLDFSPLMTCNDDHYELYSNGTLVFNRPQRTDEAIYQCFAENQFGTSVSIKVHFREALLNPFPAGSDIIHRVQLGTPLTLDCVPPRSLPIAVVEWGLQDQYGRLEPIIYSDRVTKDLEYRLHITNVKDEDSQNGKMYVCLARNSVLRSYASDTGHSILPQGTTEVQSRPENMWVSPTHQIGLKGENLKLKCIFSGNPTPGVFWTYPGEDSETPNKVILTSYGQEITITDLQESDAGTYECYGRNLHGTSVRTFEIRLESKPVWADEPNDIEAAVGSNATFSCNADGIPTPNIFWYINGVPLADSTKPIIRSARFSKPDAHTLKFVNLARDDTMVLQCNVSNKHGYVFADVYLHV